MGSFPFRNWKLPILKPNIDRPVPKKNCVVNKQINIRDKTKIIVDIDIVTNDILLICCVLAKYDRLLFRIFNVCGG